MWLANYWPWFLEFKIGYSLARVENPTVLPRTRIEPPCNSFTAAVGAWFVVITFLSTKNVSLERAKTPVEVNVVRVLCLRRTSSHRDLLLP